MKDITLIIRQRGGAFPEVWESRGAAGINVEAAGHRREQWCPATSCLSMEGGRLNSRQSSNQAVARRISGDDDGSYVAGAVSSTTRTKIAVPKPTPPATMALTASDRPSIWWGAESISRLARSPARIARIAKIAQGNPNKIHNGDRIPITRA